MNWLEWAAQQEWCLRVTIWPRTWHGFTISVKAKSPREEGHFHGKTLAECIDQAREMFGGPQ